MNLFNIGFVVFINFCITFLHGQDASSGTAQRFFLKQEEVAPPETNFQCGQTSINFGSRGNINQGADEESPLGKTPASPNAWPWMALIGKSGGASIRLSCGGVLINEEFVMTTTDCAQHSDNLVVVLGEHDYNRTDETLNAPVERKVGRVFVHPKFKATLSYHNIALLQLSTPVKLSNEILPLCLPWGSKINENLVDEKVTLTGWGLTSFGGQLSPVLNEVEVNVYDPSVCEESYSALTSTGGNFPFGMTRDTVLCAGDTTKGRGSCTGDSGGPVVHKGLDGLYTLAGIISSGYGCGVPEFPDLSVALQNRDTLFWIKKTAF